MQNLTEVSSYDANISVPEEGEEITAAASGAGRGPIRVSLQSLANRAKYLKDRIAAVLDGTLSFRALMIDGTGDQTTAPADGSLYVSGDSSLGNTEIGGTLVVSGASASARKFISTVDSGGLAVPYGVLVQDLSPFGVAHSAADGTLLHHANIAPHPSTPKPSTGRYTLILQTCPPSCTALSDGDPAPITLLVSVNDPAETGRGDTFLYRGNAWAKKQTLSGLPKVVIDIATVAQGISAGSLTKSLADMPFSIAVWA